MPQTAIPRRGHVRGLVWIRFTSVAFVPFFALAGPHRRLMALAVRSNVSRSTRTPTRRSCLSRLDRADVVHAPPRLVGRRWSEHQSASCRRLAPLFTRAHNWETIFPVVSSATNRRTPSTSATRHPAGTRPPVKDPRDFTWLIAIRVRSPICWRSSCATAPRMLIVNRPTLESVSRRSLQLARPHRCPRGSSRRRGDSPSPEPSAGSSP